MIQQFWREEIKIRKLLLVDFLLYSCTFLFVPIIPIYMQKFLNFDSSQIGFIIGIPSIICCFFGGISYLSYKKMGSFFSIILSICIDIAVSIFLLLKGNFNFIFFVYIFKGISSCIFMPIFKNLYINTLVKKENQGIIFKTRYLLICMAAILSPLIANILYPISEKIIFIIVIIINLIALSIMYMYRSIINSLEVEKKIVKLRKVASQKKNFIIFLVGCILILSVFSQFEGTFILTLDNDALSIFSKLLILNSIFGIMLQLFNIKFLKKISSYQSIILGCIFFSLSYFSFFLFKQNFIYFVFAIFLFTIGETFVLPSIEIFTTEISNNNDRIILYSMLEFKRLGFFLGPFLSGIFIKNYSSKFMFLFFAVLSLFSCLIFIYFKKNITSKNYF